MKRRCITTLASLLLAGCSAPDSNPSPPPDDASGLIGWRLATVVPFGAVDVSGLRLPDGRFVIYYVDPATDANSTSRPGRALSNDGITWTQDPTWTCEDLCEVVPEGRSLGIRREMQLADGSYRSFVSGFVPGEGGSPGTPGIVSYHSRDGLNWTREAGGRLVPDRSLEWESGYGTGGGLSAILLADGRTRLYYVGTKEGAGEQVVLSAISSDGLSFTREPGIRLNAGALGFVPPPRNGFITNPHLLAFDGKIHAYFATNHAGGQIAASEDGLDFVRKGTFPGEGADSFVLVNNGRFIILTTEGVAPGSPCGGSGCANRRGATRGFVEERMPFALHVQEKDDDAGVVRLRVEGDGGPVTLRVVDEGHRCHTDDESSECAFDATDFSFEPQSGTPPFDSTFRFDPTKRVAWILVGASDGTTTAVAKIHCFRPPPDALACRR